MSNNYRLTMNSFCKSAIHTANIGQEVYNMKNMSGFKEMKDRYGFKQSDANEIYQHLHPYTSTSEIKNKDKKNITPSLVVDHLHNNITFEILRNTHLFKLTPQLTNILYNTDNKFKYIHSPYPNLFLDTKIEIDDLIINGILIIDYFQEGLNKLYYGENHKYCIELLKKRKDKIPLKMFFNGEKYLSICFNVIHKDEKVSSWCEITSNENDIEGGMGWRGEGNIQAEKTLDNYKIRRSIVNFVFSFFNFLYHPEIEIVKREFTNKEKGQRENIQTEPNSFYIGYKGKIRKYINEFNEFYSDKTYMKRTHSWVVRGFNRTLRSEKFKNKKGQVIFIAPYIKGIGKIKEKSYLLKGKEETLWVNQFHLQQIIKDIFPEHLVLNNTRGFLDGYEIDIYVPDLKLGFEYNGKQHYEFINVFHKDETDLDKQKERDERKNIIANERGIKLITIKYDEPLTEEYIRNKILMERERKDANITAQQAQP